ncbi:HD-domain/PDEase-like protein [Peniophora sp. CONT]|nr:HD-domain/PDEase-like protein [Peniophora sp. CONT]
MATSTQNRHIHDSIHGAVEFGSHVWRIVDTKHFQRLRHIKQLGTSYYVWPGAAHNRFEHSLGTAYLSRQIILAIRSRQPELEITDRDVRCVELAGLCHDLGHGPWSHVWDTMYIPRALKGRKWAHEDASEMMFDDMVKKYELHDIVPPEDVEFIKALIAGDRQRCPAEKSFLFEIVANKRNGIDVDKFDYMARDVRATGDSSNLSLNRLIQTSARVIDGEICYNIKDADQIYELCHTRFKLHKTIYNHKTAKAIEHMLIDAVMAAEPFLKIAEQISIPDKYLHLTDNIMPRIQASTENELEEARKIFDRVTNRDLYRCVDYKVFSFDERPILEKEVTEEAVVAAAKSLAPGRFRFPPKDASNFPGFGSIDDDQEDAEDGPAIIDAERQAALTASDLVVTMSTMHYGMKNENPLNKISFYSKRNPNRSAHATSGDLSTLQPASFAEVLLRVYAKDAKDALLVQAGYRVLMKQVWERHPRDASGLLSPTLESSQPSSSGSDASIEAVPPSTQPATTENTRQSKRTFSKTRSFGGADEPDGLFNQFNTLAPALSGPRASTSPGRVTAARPRVSQGEDDWSTELAKHRADGSPETQPAPLFPVRGAESPKRPREDGDELDPVKKPRS